MANWFTRAVNGAADTWDDATRNINEALAGEKSTKELDIARQELVTGHPINAVGHVMKSNWEAMKHAGKFVAGGGAATFDRAALAKAVAEGSALAEAATPGPSKKALDVLEDALERHTQGKSKVSEDTILTVAAVLHFKEKHGKPINDKTIDSMLDVLERGEMPRDLVNDKTLKGLVSDEGLAVLQNIADSREKDGKPVSGKTLAMLVIHANLRENQGLPVTEESMRTSLDYVERMETEQEQRAAGRKQADDISKNGEAPEGERMQKALSEASAAGINKSRYPCSDVSTDDGFIREPNERELPNLVAEQAKADKGARIKEGPRESSLTR